MAKNWKVRSRALLVGHGLLMLCLGMSLFFVSTLMSDPLYESLGYGAATVLTSVALIIPASIFAVFARRLRHPRPTAVYLWIAALSIACWLAFWLNQSAPLNVPILALLAGLHGVFWSLWYVRLAFNFQNYPVKASLLSLAAATMTFLGVILATQSELSPIHAVTIVAGYAIYIGITTLAMTILLYRECSVEAELPAPEAIRGMRTVTASVFAEGESLLS